LVVAAFGCGTNADDASIDATDPIQRQNSDGGPATDVIASLPDGATSEASLPVDPQPVPEVPAPRSDASAPLPDGLPAPRPNPPGNNTGRICSSGNPCAHSSEGCLRFPGIETGMCLDQCTTAGAECHVGDPGSQRSLCALTIQGQSQRYCAWVCEYQGVSYDCPNNTDYSCAVYDPAQPTVKLCLPRDRECDSSDPTLQACFTMDGQGSTLTDRSARGHHGTIVGPATRASGRPGQALELSGSNNYAEVPHGSHLNLPSALTIEAWIFPTVASTADVAIIDKGSHYSLVVRTDGTGHLSCIASNIKAGTLSLNQWNHVACVWQTSMLHGYINGERRISISGGGIVSRGASNSRPLRIGALTSGGAVVPQTFAGRIDSVKIYSSVRSGSQICAAAGRTWTGTACVP
jgi:hypothetical protein